MSSETITIILPAYNEQDSLIELVERNVKALMSNALDGELIIVDDGSTDKTGQLADELSVHYPNVRTVHHNKNLGKSQALKTGFEVSKGEIVVMMDADLQYNPEDILKLLGLVNQGYDVVNGWRIKRKDPRTRVIASKIYNWLIRRLFHVNIHDNNSGLKLFKRKVLDDVVSVIRRDLHRYLIPLAHHQGYKIVEVPITHNPRSAGKPKYATARRLITGPIDLVTLKLLLTFAEKPAILFALPGAVMTFIGFIMGTYLLITKYVFGEALTPHLPALILTILLILTGVALFMFGFLSEMIANLRTELLQHVTDVNVRARAHPVRIEKLEMEESQKEASPLGHKSSSSHDKLNRHFLFLSLFFIVLLGFTLRIYDLSHKSMWGDEILSVRVYSGNSIPEVIRVSSLRVHPPLYFIILHFFLYFGDSEFVARLPSVIFGVLSILLIYKVGRSFFGEGEGLISAFLLSISTLHIHFSQEARMYTLYMFLSLLSLFLFYKAIRENDIKLWIGFVISTVLGLYTHFYMLLVLLIEMPFFVFMLYKKRRSIMTSMWKAGRKNILLLVLTLIIISISLLPLLPQVFRLSESRGLSTPWGIKAETFYVVLFRNFSVDRFDFSVGYGLLLFLATFLIGLFTSIREYRQPTTFLLVWVFLPSTVVFILTLNVGEPVVAEKYLIFILPGYLIGISRGISSIASSLLKRLGSFSMPFTERKKVVVSFTIAVVVFGGVNVIPLQHYYRIENTNWRAAAEYLETNSNPGDFIIAPAGHAIYLSYYYDENSKNTTLVSPTTKEEWLKIFAANLSSVDAGLWFVTLAEIFTDPLIEQEAMEVFKNWLAHNFVKIKSYSSPGWAQDIVILYRPKGLILVSTRDMHFTGLDSPPDSPVALFRHYNDSATFNVHIPKTTNYTIAIRVRSVKGELELVIDSVSRRNVAFRSERWSRIELPPFLLNSGLHEIMIRNSVNADVVFDQVAIWPSE